MAASAAASATAAAAVAAAATVPVRAGAGRVWAWRAHAWGGAGELRLDCVRAPALTRPDHVLVRVTRAALNPLDAAMLRGYGSTLLAWRRRLDADAPPAPPLVPGRDATGEVEAAGPEARVSVGARVWLVSPPQASGTLTQRVLVRAENVGLAPESGEGDGALYAGLTARSALRAAGMPRKLLVLGAGGVGQAALQLAVAARAQVWVSAAADTHDVLRALGAADTLDYRAPDYDDRLASLPKFDAIVDCAGQGGWEAAARRWRYSRFVTLTTPLLRLSDERGALLGPLAAGAALAAQNAAAARAAADRSLPPPQVRWAFFSSSAEDIHYLRRLIDAGRYRVLVEREFSWREVPAAIEHLERGHARGKILVDFTAN